MGQGESTCTAPPLHLREQPHGAAPPQSEKPKRPPACRHDVGGFPMRRRYAAAAAAAAAARCSTSSNHITTRVPPSNHITTRVPSPNHITTRIPRVFPPPSRAPRRRHADIFFPYKFRP
jgi:hypothetical protein